MFCCQISTEIDCGTPDFLSKTREKVLKKSRYTKEERVILNSWWSKIKKKRRGERVTFFWVFTIFLYICEGEEYFSCFEK